MEVFVVVSVRVDVSEGVGIWGEGDFGDSEEIDR